MSDEEKEILAEANTKKAKRVRKSKEELKAMKEEMFEEEKKNLPSILEDKTKQLVALLEDKDKKFSYAEMYSLISRQDHYAIRKIYTTDEILFAFQAFQGLVNRINEKVLFVPTINVFCGYLGVSTTTYKSWLASGDEDRRELMQIIDDYLADVALSLAQNRKIDGLVTMYRTKSQHNIVEANAPLIIEHRKGADLDEITERLKMIKKGNVIDADYKDKGNK